MADSGCKTMASAARPPAADSSAFTADSLAIAPGGKSLSDLARAVPATGCSACRAVAPSSPPASA
eukprot:5909323-Pleurochrysis_carterae.AAC.1